VYSVPVPVPPPPPLHAVLLGVGKFVMLRDRLAAVPLANVEHCACAAWGENAAAASKAVRVNRGVESLARVKQAGSIGERKHNHLLRVIHVLKVAGSGPAAH